MDNLGICIKHMIYPPEDGTGARNQFLGAERLGDVVICTQFKTEHKDYDQMKPYVREPVPGNRHTNATKIQKGMSPEQVINLVDCPDYMPGRIWQYDIDANEPYTLALSWSDDQKVKEIEFIRPALWKEGTLRDSDY